jgi:hypothetical protein
MIIIKVEPQYVKANFLILHMESSRPREVKLLGHGHIASEILEICRTSEFEGNLMQATFQSCVGIPVHFLIPLAKKYIHGNMQLWSLT